MSADSDLESLSGAYCTRNVAMPMATGTARNNAKSELSTVTLNMSRMPNRMLSGSLVFHSDEVKKLTLFARREGVACMTRTIAIRAMRATMTAPAATVTPRNTASAFCEDRPSRRSPLAPFSVSGTDPELPGSPPDCPVFRSAWRSTDS